MPEKRVGKVEHYYPKAKAVAVGLTDDIKVGDEVHIVGHGDNVHKKVTSLQLDHVPIREAHAGQHVGIGLATKVHEGDDVLLAVQRAGQATRKAKKASPKAAKRPAKIAKAKPIRKAPKKAAKKAAKRPTRSGKSARAKPPRKSAQASRRKAPARKRR